MNDVVFKIAFYCFVVLPTIFGGVCALIALMTDEQKYAKYSVALCLIMLLGLLIIGAFKLFLA